MSGLILPPSARQEERSAVESAIDLYDSEILKIEQVLEQLNAEDVGKPRPLEDFVQKVTELFAKIGLVVDVKVWTAADNRGQEIAGTFIPEITITGRVDRKHEFDYDRQVHEVTNDLLDLGEGGVIHTQKMKPGA